ncbi:MAG: S-layer homology domain-containing protein [Candidatus Peribacteria bacterium]|nr:S-layer homology domain-containing protein [Candidatus Peribacteria bacterium]
MISLAEPLPFPKVYEDIDTSLYTDAILALYSNGILQGGTQFYPNNYVRISDFIRVVVDTYRLIL